MKFFLYILLISFCACKTAPLTTEQKIHGMIDSAIVKSLDDPKSYESVGFKMKRNERGEYMVRHSFRAKNKFGALVLQEECFLVDKNLKEVDCCYRGCPFLP